MKTNNSNNNNLFYLIWKNIYIRSLIKSLVLKDKDIVIDSIQYLNDNHQYLSLLSDRVKIENHISTILVINRIEQWNLYINHQYKHLINVLRIKIKDDNGCALNCSMIHDGVVKVMCNLGKHTQDMQGQLPPSVKYLYLSNSYDETVSPFDNILLNLPSKLQVLELPFGYQIRTNRKIKIPESVDSLYYLTDCSNFSKLEMPSRNKVYDNLRINIASLDQLVWINTQCVNNILIAINESVPLDLIPRHIKSISLYGNLETPGSLPDGLVKAEISSISTKITLPPTLKFLMIHNVIGALEKDWFPSTLEYLILLDYNQTLDIGVLTSHLVELNLSSFNQELQVGVLPSSLKRLCMMKFNQPLSSSIFPHQLEVLVLNEFNNSFKEPDILPASLVHLELPSFNNTGSSFKHVVQLNKLQFLKVYNLESELSRVIANVKKITIEFNFLTTTTTDFNIQHTAIEYLDLNYTSFGKRLPLEPNLIPKQIKVLKLNGFESNESNTKQLIPSSCCYFKINS